MVHVGNRYVSLVFSLLLHEHPTVRTHDTLLTRLPAERLWFYKERQHWHHDLHVQMWHRSRISLHARRR